VSDTVFLITRSLRKLVLRFRNGRARIVADFKQYSIILTCEGEPHASYAVDLDRLRNITEG
jgi:hypothetical protein